MCADLRNHRHADVSCLDSIVFEGKPFRDAKIVKAKTAYHVNDIRG